MSLYLVMLLQEADEETRIDRLSEMTDGESTALQKVWVAVLEEDDPAVRFAAVEALALSAP